MSIPHRRFAVRPFVTLLVCLAVANSCGPNPNSPTSITGTWVGTITNSTGNPVSSQLTLSQSGSSITGFFANTAPGVTSSNTGSLTGTLNGSMFTAALAFSSGCIRTLTGTWSGTALSGTYVSAGGGLCGDSGTFALTLE